MEVDIEGKKFQVRELKYAEALDLTDLTKSGQAKKLVQCSCDLSDEDFNEITLAQGKILQDKVLEVNNLGDFQKPSGEPKQS